MKLAQLIAQKEAITAAKAEVDQKYYERNNFELSIKELIRQEERRIREEKRNAYLKRLHKHIFEYVLNDKQKNYLQLLNWLKQLE